MYYKVFNKGTSTPKLMVAAKTLKGFLVTTDSLVTSTSGEFEDLQGHNITDALKMIRREGLTVQLFQTDPKDSIIIGKLLF